MPGAHRAVLVLAALAVTVAIPQHGVGASDEDPGIPNSLGEPAERLQAGLAALADAESAEQARSIHEERVRPPAASLTPYAADLAGPQGDLLVSYLDQLADSVEAGNLSDARSLAGAAASTVDSDVGPAANRWDANRTALMAGPPHWTEDGLAVSVVLANPPPGGVGAFDVELAFDPPVKPSKARLDVGRGQADVDPANRTARWGSFDTASLARLDGPGPDRVSLGTVQLAEGNLSAGDALTADATAHEIVDRQGEPIETIGLQTNRTIPPDEAGLGLPTTWLALAGAGLGTAALAWWVRGWEV